MQNNAQRIQNQLPAAGEFRGRSSVPLHVVEQSSTFCGPHTESERCTERNSFMKGPCDELCPFLQDIGVLHILSSADVARATAPGISFAYRPSAFETFKKNIDYVSVVSPEPFIVDASGLIYGELEPRLLKLAKEHNVRIMPQIKNIDVTQGLFRKEWVHAILNDSKAGERAIRSMVDLCKRYGLWGMQIDFENIQIDDRDAMTSFVRRATNALHDEGFKLSVAAVHRSEEYAGANTYTQWMMKEWRGGYDLKAIGEIADFVKIMSYGQHTRRTTPGPSQGLPWLEQVIRYFLLFVPPQKLSLASPWRGSVLHRGRYGPLLPECQVVE